MPITYPICWIRPQQASYTYPTPTETYSNAGGVTASTLFNRKKEAAKEGGVWCAYSYPTTCCNSQIKYPYGRTSKCKFLWTVNIDS